MVLAGFSKSQLLLERLLQVFGACCERLFCSVFLKCTFKFGQRHQKATKGTQKPDKWLPEESKWIPKSFQRVPKTLSKIFKRPQEAPKGLPKALQRPQGFPRKLLMALPRPPQEVSEGSASEEWLVQAALEGSAFKNILQERETSVSKAMPL